MRIAIVQETIDLRRGGAETSTVEMARRLAELGADVTLVCRGPDEFDGPVAGGPPVHYHRIAASGWSRAERTRAFVQGAERFCAGEFDIVHAVTPCGAANVYQPRGGTYAETVRRSVAAGAGPLSRLVRSIGRRFNFRQRFLLRIERQMLRRADPPFVAAISDYVKTQVCHAYPQAPPQRIWSIFNGVDIRPVPPEEASRRRSEMRAQLGVEHGRPFVLFVAHNFKLKGLAELIRATATPLARNADWLVFVAGRDDLRRYARLARRLDVAYRLRFLGDEHEPRLLYNAADVLAHPTWYDPCSRVVLEALCCGLPVATTRWNGAAEVMQPGRHGEVIDSPDEPERLATAIARCFDVGLARACREDAPAMREKLSMARHARELMVLYRHVVASCG
jgi:UDP-glucose:(heptosyl)LPS alpha-1,3-glucosyltransferase